MTQDDWANKRSGKIKIATNNIDKNSLILTKIIVLTIMFAPNF